MTHHLRSRRPYDAAAVWPRQHGVHDSCALSANVGLRRLLVASWRKARNHGLIFCDQIWGKTTKLSLQICMKPIKANVMGLIHRATYLICGTTRVKPSQFVSGR